MWSAPGPADSNLFFSALATGPAPGLSLGIFYLLLLRVFDLSHALIFNSLYILFLSTSDFFLFLFFSILIATARCRFPGVFKNFYSETKTQAETPVLVLRHCRNAFISAGGRHSLAERGLFGEMQPSPQTLSGSISSRCVETPPRVSPAACRHSLHCN